MTKAELMEIEEKYGFEIVRNPITKEAAGSLYKQCRPDAEIDKIIKDINAERNPLVIATASYFEGYASYSIYCPKTWFDLWGWK